jgi:hypothetical protein
MEEETYRDQEKEGQTNTHKTAASSNCVVCLLVMILLPKTDRQTDRQASLFTVRTVHYQT